jgi:hypothetical protein
MNFNLASQTYGAISLKPVVPMALAKSTIPGSLPQSAEGAYGKILFQQINCNAAHLVYSVFVTRKDLALDFRVDGTNFITHIAWTNDYRIELKGTGFVYLKEGQFNCLHSASIQGTVFLEKGKQYETISIHHSPKQLEGMISFVPVLRTFAGEATDEKNIVLMNEHRWIDSAVIDTASELFKCPFKGTLRQIHFDHKTRDLLLALFKDPNNESYLATPTDPVTDLISDARKRLASRFSELITLNKIARRLGIDAVRLRKEFKQLCRSTY